MKKTVLITSVGSLVGQNILDALERRRERLRIIGTNSIAEAANNFRCDKAFLVPFAVEQKSYAEALVSIIETEKPDVIIPGRDDDIVILARLKEQMPVFRECFLVGSEVFGHMMDDKVESYRFAQKYGLPFAPTVASGTETAEQELKTMIETYGFPLIAKPCKGNGSRGIWAVMEQSQLDRISKEEDYAIQPLFGHSDDLNLDTTFGLPFVWEVPENSLYAVQVLIGRSGEIIRSMGFVAKMVAGKCELLQRCSDPEPLDIARRFAECAVKEGWYGPFNVQLKKDMRFGFQVIEMNGRFTGGTSARIHFGYDEVGQMINIWSGADAVVDTSVQGEVEMVTKILSDFPIKQADMEQLKAEKVWQVRH